MTTLRNKKTQFCKCSIFPNAWVSMPCTRDNPL